MTTGSTASRAHRVRPFSARARIVGWLMLIAAVALATTLVIATRVLLSQADDRVDAELAHEADKLRTWVSTETAGEHFSSASGLLRAYLQRALPEEDETFFSVVDGRAEWRAREDPVERLDLDRAFVARAAEIAATGEPVSGVWPGDTGEARFAVLPVHVAGVPSAAADGALVVVEFTATEQAETFATLRVLAIVIAVALAAAGVASWLVAGRLLRPIRTVRQTAEQIGETDLSQRIEVRGDDDVADLARTFNRMLDRLESAFTLQRRFLDDAGHELRTPLTVVRGHLELMSDDPADREATLELVGDELGRMSRIVEELMVLARSEQPDFVVLGDVDIADLTVEVAAKSRPLGDRRWTVAEVAEATVRADGQRLTQALMQLAHNAVRHTEVGGRITFGSAVHGDRVLLWVQDDGTGIAAEEQQLIFERFRRATSSPSAEGSGLGLAIVSSIAHAHGGSVSVDSEPGHGARFTLDLPFVAPLVPAPASDPTPAQNVPHLVGQEAPR